MDSLIVFCAKYLILFVVLGMGVVWLRVGKNNKMRLILVAVIAGVAALVASRIAGKLYYDPRPFVSHAVTPLIPHGPDNGFPSDHSLFAMTLTAVTYFFSKKIAGLMLAMTVLIGAARVMAHVHSPIDIIGAWLIAILCAVGSYYLVQRFSAKKTPAHDPKEDNA